MITKSQGNFIKKNYKRKSTEDISRMLRVDKADVNKYIEVNLKQANKNIFEKKEVLNFAFNEFFKNNWWIFFILATLVFISYSNSLNNSFVSDDLDIVKYSESIKNFTHIAFSSFFSFSRALLYKIILDIAGLNPFYFRLVNVIFHLGITYLIYIIVSLLNNRKVAFFTSIFFAVHPILTEAIVWISAGIYLQYSFFFLLAFLTYILSKNNKKYYILSVIFFVISVLSSERAIVLFFVFPLYEICFSNLRKNFKKTLTIFIISIVFILFSFVNVGQRISVLQSDYYQDAGFTNPFIQVPFAITSYLQLIFWPQGLAFYHSEMSIGQFEFVLKIIVFIVIISGGIYSYKKNKYIFFWLTFFVIPLLPTLTPLKISWIVAERYVYLGALGIFAIVAMFFQKLNDLNKYKTFSYIIITIIVVSLSLRTIIRNTDWLNQDTLWLATAKTSPNSHNNRNNLGDYYGRQGEYKRAIEEYKTAIKIKPNYADAYHNLGNTYANIGSIDEAIKSYQKAIYYNPKLWQSYQNLAAIYFQQGMFEKSIEYLTKAISINKDVKLQISLSVVYAKAGQKEKAKQIIMNILNVDPSNELAKKALTEINKD